MGCTAQERFRIYWNLALEINELVELNIAERCDPVEEEKADAVEAVTEVINSFRMEASDVIKKTTALRVKCSQKRVFNPAELIANAEMVAQEAARKLRKKMEKVVRQTCQFVGCGEDRRGRRKWKECEYCSFVVCSQHDSILAEHSRDCVFK